MKKIRFLRRNTDSLSKLGLRRKKLQKWRAPKGRDNKMRLRKKGHPRTVEIGYKKDGKFRGKVNGMIPKMISNLKDLEKVNANETVMLGRIGKKKKIEFVKIAKEKRLKVVNFNVGKFLKENKEREVKVEEEGKVGEKPKVGKVESKTEEGNKK